MPHNAGLKTLNNMLEAREHEAVSTDEFVKVVRLVLENNFEFDGEVKKQISGTAIGTKFVPSSACIFMDELKIRFLQPQSQEPLI